MNDILEAITDTRKKITNASNHFFEGIKNQILILENEFEPWPSLREIYQRRLLSSINRFTADSISVIQNAYDSQELYKLFGHSVYRMTSFNNEIEKFEVIQCSFLLEIDRYMQRVLAADIPILDKISIHQEIHASITSFFDQKLNLIHRLSKTSYRYKLGT
jgi:hypothetical protein